MEGMGSHAIVRAWEQYKLDLTPCDLDRLCAQIQARQGVGVIRESRGILIGEISVRGTMVRFVFNKDGRAGRGKVVTFLPRSGDEVRNITASRAIGRIAKQIRTRQRAKSDAWAEAGAWDGEEME